MVLARDANNKELRESIHIRLNELDVALVTIKDNIEEINDKLHSSALDRVVDNIEDCRTELISIHETAGYIQDGPDKK